VRIYFPLSLSAPVPTAAFRRPLAFRLWLYVWIPCAKIAGLAVLVGGHPVLAPFVFFSPGFWLIWQYLVPTSHGFGPAIRRFHTTRREVWLTIDDGPDPRTTPPLLDLLDAHRARATFFVIGEKISRHPQLIAEILRRGHTLGNHTHTHPQQSFWIANHATTAAEIERCENALRAAGASATRWFRPPVGLKSLALHRQLAPRGLELVLWSARGYDTLARQPSAAVRHVLRGITPGAIVLLHESGPPDSPRLEIIARVLERLSAHGYMCVLPPSETLIRA
jgi:peptidoglycan/xylan/chitin deacetylase (PgdA/CDA1 family)